ncbi:hypothetical protein LOK49_LG13G00285 [Camellia lanceoleosa]|uniref:Uncharacterized protein n=1 Tax=Camellia lanceoleosa TaxID=1840588 RepID=A0ACC0FFK7_9ERIC|nr:hypothetical protein LOK49_LG13G00285 [Camellia lanceoleosa]
MMLLPHGAGEGGGIHEVGRGDEGMDRDGYQDLETEIKSWQPEDRNSGVFCSYAADNLDLIPKCPRAKWELKDEIKCVVSRFISFMTKLILEQVHNVKWVPAQESRDFKVKNEEEEFSTGHVSVLMMSVKNNTQWLIWS